MKKIYAFIKTFLGIDTKLLKGLFTGGFFLNSPFVVNATITLVTLPIVLANLSIDHYGKWQFVLALETWLAVLTAANITLSSKKGIAQNLNGTFLHAFLFRLKLLVPVGIIVLGIAFSLRISGNNVFSSLLMILGLYLIFGYLFQISFYEFLIAKKRFKEWCLWQAIISFVAIVGSAIVALTTKNIVYFALFQLGSISVLGWIAWLIIVRRENLIDSYRKGEVDKGCVPFGLKLIPVGLITITANKLSHFLIGPFFGFANLAVFSLADNLRNKSSSVMKSARPLLYADFAQIESKALMRLINIRLLKVGILSVLLTIVIIFIGWAYIQFFLPQTFHQAIIYFAILAIGLPAAALAIILHTALESHLHYKELSLVGIVSSALKILLILILGYFWQIIGVCIGLAISAWITFIFYYFLTIRKDLAIGVIGRFHLFDKFSPEYLGIHSQSDDSMESENL